MLAVSREQLSFLLCSLLLLSFMCWEISPLPMSLSMIGLLVLGFWGNSWKTVLHNVWNEKAWLAFIGVFVLVLASGLWSYDAKYFAERLQIKLPFLALPLAFAGLPKMDDRRYMGIFYLLLIVMSIAMLGVLLNYAMHFREAQVAIGQSQSIQTPFHHIRFSLLAALSFFAGCVLWWRGFRWKYDWENKLIAALTLFMFVGVHIIAVRSGLVALYAGCVIVLLRKAILEKQYIAGLGGMLLIVALPLAAYQYIPSFQTKVSLMRWNLQVYKSGEIGQYSDTQRWLSYQVAFDAVRERPWLGAGVGDVKLVTEQIYRQKYPAQQPMLPHNQFMFFFVGIGLIGTAIYALLFFFPLLYHRRFQDSLFLAFHIIALSSFMTETTLETAVGTAFYIFFACLGTHYLHYKEKAY